MARIYPICSSSGGNCTFIGTRGNGILVDVGCSHKMLKSSLELIDTNISGIEAIFITHEHIDHIKGLEQIIKHTKIPVFSSAGTISYLKNKIPTENRYYDITREKYVSAGFEVSSFRTSHDAAESVGYKVRYHGSSFAVCTDTGVITNEARAALRGCETVLLESNYDVEMLRKNPKYHADLKRRILSDRGHLSNNDCAEFAAELVRSDTAHIVLGHLSRENNTPDTAYSCTRDRLKTQGLETERDYTLNIAPVNTQGEYISV